jgi:hypothetical protein
MLWGQGPPLTWLATTTQVIVTLCCFQHLDHGRQTVTPSLNNQQLMKQEALVASSPHNNDVAMTHSPTPNNHTPPGSVGQSHVSPAGQFVSKCTDSVPYMALARSAIDLETAERILMKFDTRGLQ